MTKKQKLILFCLCSVILIVILFIKSHKTDKESVPDNTKNQSSSITCSELNLETIVPLIDFSGRINSVSKINIVSEVNGVSKFTNSRFEVGEIFKKGEVLIYIKDDDVDLELKSIKSQFLTLLVQVLPDIRMDFPSLGNKFQNYINNFSLDGKIASLPKITGSKQRNFLSSRQVFANYYTIKALENKLEKFKIRAPFDGIVTKALIDPGSNVIIGQPIGEFIDPNKYELSTSVSLNEASVIQKGNKVIIASDDIKGEITAVVSRIGNHINELTQSIDVFMTIETGLVKDGMYVSGKINCDTLTDVHKLKRSSIINNTQVYILQNDSLQTQDVDVILFQNDYAIIKSLNNNCIVKEHRNYFYKGMPIK